MPTDASGVKSLGTGVPGIPVSKTRKRLTGLLQCERHHTERQKPNRNKTFYNKALRQLGKDSYAFISQFSLRD